ncbi:MAG: DUF5686 family protein [Bacteroidota bacterium]
MFNPFLHTRSLTFITVILGCALSTFSFAQTTKVTGKAIDKETKEALIYVHITFTGTKVGTVTDMDGNFTLESYYAGDSITATAVGYRTMTKKIKKDKVQEVIFEMVPADEELEEFVFTASKEDPAIAIFKNIIKYKDVNNREKLAAYQYEVYNKVEFDLNNLDEKFMNRKILKPVNFIFQNMDSTDEKPYLPVFMTESMSDFYFRKNPRTHKEFIKATKVSGIENESISQFLGDMYQNINVYDNMVNVFSRQFVSPISDRGMLYYEYYLLDSAFMGNDWCYKIRFVPKRKSEPTFVGQFWVNDTTYAIRKFEAGISETANINFIEYFEFMQEFKQVENEVWMLSNDYLLVDFNLTDKQMGMYGRKTTSYRQHVINKPKDDEFYAGANNIIVADDAEEKDNTYWDTVRHDTLSENEKAIYYMMDTIQNIPQVKSFVEVVGMLISGYKVFGKVEWGPYFSTYSFNRIEGSRFRFGGRTSNEFSRKIEFNGYCAYGVKDDRFKYGGGFRAKISKKPRQIIGANYKYDIEQLGLSSNSFKPDNFMASVFRRNVANKLTMAEEYRVWYDYEFFQGLNNQLQFRRRTLEPLGETVYLQHAGNNDYVQIDDVTATEFTYYLRYAKDEKFVSGEFDRISLGTSKPVFDVQYSLGIKDFLGSDYGYHKTVASITQWVPVGTLGWFRYRLEGGKFWGRVPYQFLEIHRGNETYYFDEYSFNTMNYLEFVSDQYASVWFTHHFDGFFLNHIPLLRRLKFREVAGIKAIWGTINDQNRNEIQFPSYLSAFGPYPFMEMHVGLENILKVLQVDIVWRMTYLDKPDVAPFGIRAKFDVDF